MPTRPSQTDPAAAARWAEVRALVGANVRRLRLEAGLTQEALALESGIDRNLVIGIEHGRRSILSERLPDIAAVLGCSVGDLFGASQSQR